MPNILIIEDQEKIRKLLVVSFKRENYKTCDGIDWGKAVEFLNKNVYDLIIVDLEVKSSAGFEMLKLIKLTNPTAEIVAIFNSNEYDKKKKKTFRVFCFWLCRPF